MITEAIILIVCLVVGAGYCLNRYLKNRSKKRPKLIPLFFGLLFVIFFGATVYITFNEDYGRYRCMHLSKNSGRDLGQFHFLYLRLHDKSDSYCTIYEDLCERTIHRDTLLEYERLLRFSEARNSRCTEAFEELENSYRSKLDAWQNSVLNEEGNSVMKYAKCKLRRRSMVPDTLYVLFNIKRGYALPKTRSTPGRSSTDYFIYEDGVKDFQTLFLDTLKSQMKPLKIIITEWDKKTTYKDKIFMQIHFEVNPYEMYEVTSSRGGRHTFRSVAFDSIAYSVNNFRNGNKGMGYGNMKDHTIVPPYRPHWKGSKKDEEIIIDYLVERLLTFLLSSMNRPMDIEFDCSLDPLNNNPEGN